MKRLSAIAGSTLFLLIAPGTVMVYVPFLISRWRIQPPLLGFPAFRGIGILLILLGAPLLLDSFVRFALDGLGTPAPIAPPERLVVTGLYRYVRNPMYVGGLWLIVGQGLLFGNLRVLEYAVFVWIGFTLFVLRYEEPKLRQTFGADYETFCAAVPRWIPRITPWEGRPNR